MKKIVYVLLVVLLLTGCSTKNDFTKKVTEIAQEYSVEIESVNVIDDRENTGSIYLELKSISGFQELDNQSMIDFRIDVRDELTLRNEKPMVIVLISLVEEDSNYYTFDETSGKTSILKNGEYIGDATHKDAPKKDKLPKDEDFKEFEKDLKEFYKGKGK